jgi:hypothetical protein
MLGGGHSTISIVTGGLDALDPHGRPTGLTLIPSPPPLTTGVTKSRRSIDS